MYTQCPECLTIYEIDEDALQASLGIVHCGRCQKRFDALRTLSDTLPLDPLAPLPELDPVEHAPTLSVPVPPSTIELAALRRHPRGDTSTPTQTGSSPQPSVSEPTAPSSEAAQTSDGNADDWFADLESELAASSTVGNPDTPAIGDDENAWAVELPDGANVIETDAGPASRTDPGDGDLATNPGTETDGPPDTSATSPTDAETPQEHMADTIDSPNADSLDTNAHDSSEAAPVDEELEYAASEPGIAAPIHAEAATDDSANTSAADALADSTPGETEPDTATPSAPVYVRPRNRRFSRAGVAWTAGCVVLALVLAAQLVWAKRVALLRNPATRPWVTSVCQNIPCRLPPIKNTAKIELLSRDVRPDPNVAGALMITATLRNDAAFRQPWPVVVVELTDLDNRPVAMRRFRPAEYMPNAAKRAAGIAPGATAAVAFEVTDPGKRAVAFQFSFE